MGKEMAELSNAQVHVLSSAKDWMGKITDLEKKLLRQNKWKNNGEARSNKKTLGLIDCWIESWKYHLKHFSRVFTLQAESIVLSQSLFLRCSEMPQCRRSPVRSTIFRETLIWSSWPTVCKHFRGWMLPEWRPVRTRRFRFRFRLKERTRNSRLRFWKPAKSKCTKVFSSFSDCQWRKTFSTASLIIQILTNFLFLYNVRLIFLINKCFKI